MSSAETEADNTLAPTVTVRGQAVLRAEPDEAMLWITLTALESDPATALTDVVERSQRLVSLLDDLGVAKKDRATAGVTVHEEFDHTRSGRRSLGHRAAASVSARMTDPDLIGQLITESTTELQARVQGPMWQIAARNPVHLDAAREAAADAGRKAQAFADGAGATLGPLIRLIEPGAEFAESRPHRARFQDMRAAPAAGGLGESMPIDPGEHEVSATIDATFTLRPA